MPPGLIEAKIDEKDPLKSLKGYEAERVELDPTTDTVEGRTEGIIAKDSPLMQQAATRGKQYANQRGLLNTSLGAQATQGAVMDRAIPIASQDAATSVSTKQANQAAANRSYEYTAGVGNTAAMQERGNQLQQSNMRLGADLEERLMGVAENLRRGTMTHGAEIEKDIMGLAEELRRGTLTLSNDLQKDILNVAENLKRGTMSHAAGLETGLIKERSAATVAEGWAKVAQQLELNDSTHQQALERIAAEQSDLLERMEREQRYGMEQAVVSGSQRIQEMVIAEVGAINRTEGLTPEQQKGAIDQVIARANGHMQYLSELASEAPTWDPVWETFPDFGPAVGSTTPTTTTQPVTSAVSTNTRTQSDIDYRQTQAP